MATTTVTSAPEPQAPINHFGRVTGVFFSPKRTFADIAARPAWLVPAIIVTLISVIVTIGLNQRMDWREYISQQIEKSPRAARLSDEQKQRQIEGGAKFAPIFTYVFGIPAPMVIVLVTAAVMLGGYNLMTGAGANFKQSLAIVAHSFLVTVISSALFFLILFLKPPGTVDLENPVATNLGILVPEDAAKWLQKLGASFDIFTFWILILIAIGFAAVNPRKLKGGQAFGIALGVWAVFVVLRVGWAWVFS